MNERPKEKKRNRIETETHKVSGARNNNEKNQEKKYMKWIQREKKEKLVQEATHILRDREKEKKREWLKRQRQMIHWWKFQAVYAINKMIYVRINHFWNAMRAPQ